MNEAVSKKLVVRLGQYAWFHSLLGNLGCFYDFKQRKRKNDRDKCLRLPVTSYGPAYFTAIFLYLFLYLFQFYSTFDLIRRHERRLKKMCSILLWNFQFI